MNNKVAIIGAGSIAKVLKRRLRENGYVITSHVSRKGYLVDGLFIKWSATESQICEEILSKRPSIVFLAISTLDNGVSAANYIRFFAGKNIPVVLCEKGSLAYHAKKISPFFKNIGFSAVVGGGTQMLGYLQGRHPRRRLVEISAVVNGTLNFIFDSNDGSLGERCGEAQRLGYAEPGAESVLSLINGELKDVTMKACCIFNVALREFSFLTPEELGFILLTEEELKELGRKTGYRVVVSFSNYNVPVEHAFFKRKFNALADGWYIQGGFRHVGEDADTAGWLPGGVKNAIHIVEGEFGSGGTYTLTGPGAGAEPTTTAMLNDADRLLGR